MSGFINQTGANSGIIGTTVAHAGIVISGSTGADGGTTSGGRHSDLLSITGVDLTGCTGKYLFMTGFTSIIEASNTADNIHLSVWIKNSSATFQRVANTRSYSLGTNLSYSQPIWALTATGLWQITSAFAKPACEMWLLGGMDGTGSFIYGDGYGTTGDGEQCGVNLSYFVA